MKITHENLLENGWDCIDANNQKYISKFHLNVILFLSKNYGIDDNYMIQLLFPSTDFASEAVKVNINCISIKDLQTLEHLVYKASAVSSMKRLLLNY
jgi:hypothetical protein